jgi:hypothetical protein
VGHCVTGGSAVDVALGFAISGTPSSVPQAARAAITLTAETTQTACAHAARPRPFPRSY